jgi:hypothetical protein
MQRELDLAPMPKRAVALRSFAAWALAFVAPASCAPIHDLPRAPAPGHVPQSAEEAAIERKEICVGSTVASAGDLAEDVYYRAAIAPSGQVIVGYFVFFSEERPWGNNWLTWTVLPALAVDLVYSRALMVMPGLQRALYGKGDVEGVRIVYDVGRDGALVVDHAVADDGTHDPVRLERKDLFAVDPTRPVVYTDVWSHQLGARGATSAKDFAYLRCYRPGHIFPLPDTVASDFEIESRAPPAHVERLAGRPLGAAMRERVAKAP